MNRSVWNLHVDHITFSLQNSLLKQLNSSKLVNFNFSHLMFQYWYWTFAAALAK